MSDFTRNMAPINRAVLEALKPMGRMDGDMAFDSVGYEVAVEWRQKCEQLQGRVAQLEATKARLEDRCEKWHKEAKAAWAQLGERCEEIERLKAECERFRIANDQFHDERDKWHDEARKAWAQLREQPKASPVAEFNHKVECDNVSLRIIVKHLIGLI
jgi:predicted nuclease with TOPRIM domain